MRIKCINQGKEQNRAQHIGSAMEVVAIISFNPDPGCQQISPLRWFGTPGGPSGKLLNLSVPTTRLALRTIGILSEFVSSFSNPWTPSMSPLPSTVLSHKPPSPHPHLGRQALPPRRLCVEMILSLLVEKPSFTMVVFECSMQKELVVSFKRLILN